MQALRKVATGARPGWKAKAEDAGFTFHTIAGEPYWDEDTAYELTQAEAEGLERAATELHAMCREAAGAIVGSEEFMDLLAIPEGARDLVAASWAAGEPELYGRLDLAHDGDGPAKLLEYNADTPTSLYEAAAFQREWLEECRASGLLAPDAGQLNSIEEALEARFREILPPVTEVHFACSVDNPEDLATVETLAWAARAAGHGAHLVDMAAIGLTDRGQFADGEDQVIGTLFKLYPYEDLLRDDWAPRLGSARLRLIEPPWKACLSNKGLLPVLWRLFEGHPSLLPAVFEHEVEAGAPVALRARDALARGSVTKPLFSREGSSITIREGGVVTEAAADRSYDGHPRIVQAYHPLPVHEGWRPVAGAWIVGEACVGLGLREDRSRITQDLSRFKPHYVAR
jgi:glutathionylspermidine synthase